MDALTLAHERYISSLEVEKAHDELGWISNILDIFRELCLKHTELVASIENKTKENVTRSSLKLERMKLPRFSGDLKDYTRFKADFNKFVVPEVDSSKIAYVLKSCLDSEPYKFVKNGWMKSMVSHQYLQNK